MDLYLIRHAHAGIRIENDEKLDFERPVSDEGRVQIDRLAHFVASKGIMLKRLYTSPLVRARQTAEVIAPTWGIGADNVVTCLNLVPEGKFRGIAKQVNKDGLDSVGLVGHEPDLGQLAAWLIGTRRAAIKFAKGGMAYIRINEDQKIKKGSGKLIWMLTPALIG